MGARGMTALAVTVTVVLATGAGYVYVDSHRIKGSAERTAEEYFAAWRAGRLDRMAELVAAPPADFARQHRALASGLLVQSIELEPGAIVADAAARPAAGTGRAHVEYEVSRALAGRGTWRYRSTLRLAVRDRRWKVIWSPATLHPALQGPATWQLVSVEQPGATFTARDGRPLDEAGSLQPYVAAMSERFGAPDSDTPGWAVSMTKPGREPERLAVLGADRERKIRTSIDRKIQTAAERAVATVSEPAAIVAVRPSTGEVLAIADGLGGRNAFLGAYPPGSTFKVVTAAALLSSGLGPGSGAPCPASALLEQRTIVNHDGVTLGDTTLRDAFAQSCNTTFARFGVERLGAGRLADAARSFGFEGPIAPGPAAVRGAFPPPGGAAELAEASIGQGKVQASPLVMAMVAAAVKDGTWRSPRLIDTDLIRDGGDRPQDAHDVPNATALRTLMRAVVTDGTAARAGLPGGTGGKTGTAEVGGGERDHAWFIGYKGDLAFTAFVENGGSGPGVAAPLAARFLRGL